MTHGFSEDEHKRYIAALNFIATEATFNSVNTVKGSIELYKHFSFLQSMAKKLEDHILEVRAVHPPEDKKAKGKGK